MMVEWFVDPNEDFCVCSGGSVLAAYIFVLAEFRHLCDVRKVKYRVTRPAL